MTLSLNGLISFAIKVCGIAAHGMTQLGIFHKEGIYQEKLQHDMNQQMNISSTREQVMPIRFADGGGNQVTLGNGQFLRTDIELQGSHKGILLELKATHASIKEEHIHQLKNYLDQRVDLYAGMVVNYNSSYKKKDGIVPCVEIILLMKTEEFIVFNDVKIRKYQVYQVSKDTYPPMSDYMIKVYSAKDDKQVEGG